MAAGGRGKLAPAEVAPAAFPSRGLAVAGAAAGEVVRRVRPTEASERRRAEVVDYARRLVGSALGCEVRSSQCAAVQRRVAPVRARGAVPRSLSVALACAVGLGWGNRLVMFRSVDK
jgi:hypothetical protein